MADKPLFRDLIAAHPGLAEELKTIDVAADLTLLLHESGMSREDLASKLSWSGDRVIPPISTEPKSRTVMQPWPDAALG